jgi:integrase/recombinase XerD
MKAAETIEHYIQHRRSTGMKFISQATSLHSFARFAGNLSLNDIDAEMVRVFLFARGVSAQTSNDRCSTLKGLYRFAMARNLAAACPLPVRMSRVTVRLTPYVYTEAELQRLSQAVGHLRPGRLQAHTLQTLMLALYGAGLRIGEALRLVMSDVDLVNRVLNVRLSKFYKDRLVPIGSGLAPVLERYAATRRYLGHSEDNDAPFFLADTGDPLSIQLAEQVFSRLRRIAEVHRQDGGRFQPRLHDLRHSFAVHRLIGWYKTGADVNLMLPKLSTYLGHLQMSHTQKYLTMTPELLQQASLRFEAFAGAEVNVD